MDLCGIFVLGLLGRSCPAPTGTAQRKRSGVGEGRRPPACVHAQPLTASTPW